MKKKGRKEKGYCLGREKKDDKEDLVEEDMYDERDN